MANGSRMKIGGGRRVGTRTQSQQTPVVSPVVSQSPPSGTQSQARPSSSRATPSSLPRQYSFTQADPVRPPVTLSPPARFPSNTTPTPTSYRDFPPPIHLFQDQLQGRRQASSSPPLQNSAAPAMVQQHAHPSSEANSNGSEANDARDARGFESDVDAYQEPSLEEEKLRNLNALLRVPGREEFTTVLSPTIKPHTTWFGRDRGALTRKITNNFTNKFDGPYYSWTCVPRDRQERFFVEFPKTHTWDPLISGTVQQRFEKIYLTRMKDMVSTARTSRECPKWINENLWAEMTTHWDTEEAMKRIATTSLAQRSERGGLGPHKHLSGQKSFVQIQQDLEKELGRPVTLAQVFIKTHTRKDGTYVDQKAETIAGVYQKNLEAKLS